MAERSKRWEKTSHAGLVRYVPTGGLYVRVRVGGKLRWKSLDTDVLTVAALRLADFRRSAGANRTRKAKVKAGRLTLGDSGRVLLERIGSGTNKPRTKAYYGEVLKRMEKSWPNWDATDCRRVTETQCREWAGRISREFCPSVYNHAVGLLRKMFEITVELGARYDNPADRLKRLQEKPKELQLPDVTQITQLIAEIETGGSRWSRPCADFVRFLMFGGFRKTEAAHVRWRDVDLARLQITVHGDPETGTKNSEIRRVPIIPEMERLLRRLQQEGRGTDPDAPVMQVRECQKALDRACQKVGIARLTHHDLRHLFATRCIESGVDIPTVSRWLGHKDGGALAMKVYGHLRNEHSASMAQKVYFSASPKPSSQPVAEGPDNPEG